MRNDTTQLDIFDSPQVCAEPECTKVLEPRKGGRGMCQNHYISWFRANRRNVESICKNCGTTFNTYTPTQTHCSVKCQRTSASASASVSRIETADTTDRECARSDCSNTFLRADGIDNKYCTQDCRDIVLHRAVTKSALRISLETNDYPTVLSEIAKRVTITTDGCWTWNGTSGKNGYPTIKYTRVVKGKRTHTQYLLHRVVLEAKHGQPLGSQHAHHICANNKCINPDHLQPVTHRENTAEMLARQSLLARIRELEDAVRHMDANHPILDRIACA